MTNRYESKKTEEQLTCYSFYFYPIIYMYPGIYLLVLSFDLAVIYNDIVNCSIPLIVGSSYPFKTQLKEKKKNSMEKRFQQVSIGCQNLKWDEQQKYLNDEWVHNNVYIIMIKKDQKIDYR